MATIDDYIPVILGIVGTLVISVSILLLGNHLNIWRRQQQSGVSNTFNIGSMQEDFKRLEQSQEGIKGHLDRKLDGLIQLIEKKEETSIIRFEQITRQYNELDKKIYGVELRLKQLENGRRGGGST